MAPHTLTQQPSKTRPPNSHHRILQQPASLYISLYLSSERLGLAVKGFKDFVMRGNLVELAVAFIIGVAFATVVKAFTDVVLSLIGKVGGNPDFNSIQPGGVPVGAFLTAAVAFLIVAAVVAGAVASALTPIAVATPTVATFLWRSRRFMCSIMLCN